MERRLAAILAADMVGYSRLIATDETAVLTRHRRHRQELIDPKIREYGGRIVKTTGDGLLAEFPSVVDAVRCAVSIQLGMPLREAGTPPKDSIAYRIGVNLGDVVIEDGDIYGDGVNIAARLEAAAEAGGICVSQTVVDHVKARVASRFDDAGEQMLKNIPTPVHVYRVRMQPEEPGRQAPPTRRQVLSRTATFGLIAGLAIAIAAAIVGFQLGGSSETREATVAPPAAASSEAIGAALTSGEPPALGSGPPSIAVLPFRNLSQEVDQEYFADGVTEDIIISLSKIPALLVISRNTTFRLKNREIDPRELAAELGVLYLLTGSVRRGGDDVRINAQLIDARSGGSIWAERYDSVLSNVLALQGEVAEQIASALALNLSPDAKGHRGETNDPKAYDWFLRGWEHLRMRTPEHQARALEYFQQAIAIDPTYARAHAASASVYWTSYRGEWTGAVIPAEPDIYQRRRKAYEHLERAMNDPTPLALQVKSRVDLFRGRYEESLDSALEAVRLAPNDADALTTQAEALILAGRPREAFDPINKAQRLDPYNSSYHSWLLGLAHFGQDEFADAISHLERALDLSPEEWSLETGWRAYLQAATPLACAYAYAGRTGDAQNVVRIMRKEFSRANVASEVSYWLYKEEADRQRLAEGLRLAGLPES